MTKYYYVARSPTGKKEKGYLQVENENELIDIMLKHNYRLVKYRVAKNKKPLFSFLSVNKSDLLSFCENVNMMLRAGLTLKEAIHLCQDVTNKEYFKKILIEIEKELAKGKSLSNIINNYPEVFPVFFRTMINLAEISGNLKTIFEHLIRYYRFDISIRKKTLNSLFYPSLLFILCFVVIIVMSTVIVPSFIKIFNEMNVELPLITRIIIFLSEIVSKYYVLVIIILLSLGVFIYFFSKTTKGKRQIDKLKIKLIIVKQFSKISLTSRFCRSLKILIDSGIPIVSSMDICSSLLGNLYLKEKFIFAVDEIKRGASISNALYSTNFFPTLVTETIFISEKTANLSYSLDILSNIYEEELQHKIQKLTTIIEPALILFIALIVVILIIAIFIPLFSMLNNIGA